MKKTLKNVIEDYREQLRDAKQQIKRISETNMGRGCSNCLADQDYQKMKAERNELRKEISRVRGAHEKLMNTTCELEHKNIKYRKRVEELEDHIENGAFAFPRVKVCDCETCKHGSDIIGQCFNAVQRSGGSSCWEKKVNREYNEMLSRMCEVASTNKKARHCNDCKYSVCQNKCNERRTMFGGNNNMFCFESKEETDAYCNTCIDYRNVEKCLPRAKRHAKRGTTCWRYKS